MIASTKLALIAAAIAAGLVPVLADTTSNSSPNASPTGYFPAKVTIAELLQNRERWQSNRVEVVGQYRFFFEHSVLTSRKGEPPDEGIWIDRFRVAPIGIHRINQVSNGPVRIVGTFRFYPARGAGHAGMCPAEITYLELLEESREEMPQGKAVAPQKLAGVAEAARSPAKPKSANPSERVVAFYYPWYGNPGTDGGYANWNHPVAVRNEPPRSYPGGDDIGANFYPSLGCYSVNDPKVLREHMRQLRQAGVGVLCASWWGKDTFTDRALPGLFKAAEEAGLFINFHIEPFPGRNAATTRSAIDYLVAKFGASPACHRLRSHQNRAVFFVYDSYLTSARDWATVLSKESTNSIRGSDIDAVVLGLWVKPDEERFMLESGFDGFYTYFATDGFTFGSTVGNWPKLADWARAHRKLFVPCVAPGYIDTRIRPWNGVNTRDREAGAYYDRMWSAALKVSPELVGITSFNEWHEGTQIETAIPKQIPGFNYLNYQPLASDYYLDRSAHWIRRTFGTGERVVRDRRSTHKPGDSKSTQ